MPLHSILSSLFAVLLVACAPAGDDARRDPAGTAEVDPAPSASTEPAEPVGAAAATAGPHHGNWRLAAADDPHDAALMAFSIQSDAGTAQGTGDFVLFQPFCDVVADAPIVGNTECELIGLGAAFDHVDIARDRVVLVFHPTADGLPHRLELRVAGEALAGDYLAGANGIRRAVIARHPPADAP